MLNRFSYNGTLARKRGQKMHFVTERCVFELREDGLYLTEIANGIDLEKDIIQPDGILPKDCG